MHVDLVTQAGEQRAQETRSFKRAQGCGRKWVSAEVPARLRGSQGTRFGLEDGVWMRSWEREKVKRGAVKLRR